MSTNRDDKFEGHEESEYHFSDEEVSYEVEAETPKAASTSGGEKKESIIARLTQSRRMLISIAVFLVLVFVAYKMVGPGSSPPSTDINAAPVVVSQPSAMPANQAALRTIPPSQVTAAAPAPASNVVPAMNQPSASAPPPAAETAKAASAQPMVPAIQTMGAGVQTNPPAVINAATQMAQQIIQQQTANQQSNTMQGAQNQPALPAVIPVPAPVLTNASAKNVLPPAPLATMGSEIDAQTAALSAMSQKAMDQLQTQYTQQINSFSSQNKALQDQIQTLNSRVADMESKLNQLVQVLTRQHTTNGSPGNTMANPAAMPPPSQAPDVKIAYNVQAIIPGRAWLKSDNGETLTVAEGDMIRDVGRVTKIDPYDGVVEINTGTRAVSLSYGNGG